ncbi:cobalamin B12-binding domain-containing protein [Thermincola ferriacetica]
MYLAQIAYALKTGDTAEIRRLTAMALEEGVSPEQILNEALIPSMEEVGQQFRGSEIFIPEVMKSARAMHGAIRLLQQKLVYPPKQEKTVKILIGTVAGDLHDIGKNLVSMFLTAKGYEVINLGIDVPVEDFVWAVRKHKPHVLAMSALLTTTMPSMLDTINELKRVGLRDKVKVLVGGGPVTKQFAEEIGADGYGYDGKAAVDWVAEHVKI